MIDWSWTTVLYFIVAAGYGVVAWAARVTPEQATTNLSGWRGRALGFLTLAAPWIKRTVLVIVPALAFWGGILFDRWRTGAGDHPIRTVAEVGLKQTVDGFVRDEKVILSTPHWETFQDGTLKLEFNRQVVPSTIQARLTGTDTNLAIVHRSSVAARFKLPITAVGETVKITVEAE